LCDKFVDGAAPPHINAVHLEERKFT